MRTPRRLGHLAAVVGLCAAAGARAQAPPPSLHADPAAALRALRCSIPGAADWREYRSAHFVLSTDASPARAAALVAQLERLHAYVVAALLGPDVDVPGRVRAVAFASAAGYRQIAPDRSPAYTTTDGWELTVVFPLEELAPATGTLAHELAREVAWQHFPRQPRWFAEGLAAFVESVAEERQDASAAILVRRLPADPEQGGRRAGYVSPALEQAFRGSPAAGARELLRWAGKIDGDPSRFRVGSRVLYHYLADTRSKALAGFQERLTNGEDPQAAWRAAFPDLDPASAAAMSRLDGELARYRQSGRYASQRVEPGAADASFRDRPIRAADLHVLLARIRPADSAGDAARRAEAAASLDEALREDPLQPEALAERARAAGVPAAAALRPVTAARPDDARGWLALADALGAPAEAAEREAALRKVVALAPERARASAELAALLVASGRAREARPFAERALDLAPWNGFAVETLAAVALGIGQCQPALALQRRAADLVPAGDAHGDGARRRLAAYEAKCDAAPAGQAAAAR